ncbi:MAG: electron transport complex subunit RsxC [Candidatus Omnitrophota bacterium]|jgi:electron transport complex protein RnfC|nr:MAG: electron transport complex subunit RsxC [Candidatus Omnitrophota bacterium]
MVKLRENKEHTEHLGIETTPLPKKVYIPLSQHLGKHCTAIVKPQESVSLGQVIGRAEAHVWAPIHASVAGKVLAIDDWMHPVLGVAKAIVIETDMENSRRDYILRSDNEVSSLTEADIIKAVFDSGIVGMGGASFPSHIKLHPAKEVDTLIINGAECEPFLNSDNRLMIEKAAQIILGIGLVAKCLNVKQVYFAIENNKPEAIEAVEKRLNGTSYKLKVIESFYPQGGEKQLIKNILNKEVPRGKLPFDIGVVVHNVATVYAIYEAVYLNKPLYERVVTITGDCIASPKNLLVRIGTPIRDLVDFCGGFKKEPSKIIFGGPMMGIAQANLDVPVVKSTNGVIFMSEADRVSSPASDCIRCSRCVQQCPVSLMPCMIAVASENEKWELSKIYGVLDCIECGVCNYVCPQKINIVQLVKYAKLRMPR